MNQIYQRHQRPPLDFGSAMSPLCKKLLIIYGSIYVIELLLEYWFNIPLVSRLIVYPLGDENFQFWQILTHPFIHNPSNPITFLINCLVLYFFAGPVENSFGARGFLFLFYLAALGALISGLAFSLVSGFHLPFSGMSPSILALVVVFGLINPEATIFLMFIFPIKAKYISYGTILVTGITFLAKADPFGAWHLGGILFGFLYLKWHENVLDPKLLYLKFLQQKDKRKKRSRFTVYQGGKGKKDDDGPTYH